MARYIERLQELLDEGKISQDEYDDLAELSAAKEAIKEFNSTKAELEDLKAFKAEIETRPKRKEALKRAGVELDALPKYGQDWLNQNIPSDRLDDLDFVAEKVKEGGFEAQVRTDDQPRERSGAEQITDFLTEVGSGAPVRTGDQAAEEAFYRDLDSVPDGDKNAIREVLAKHGRLVPDQG